MSLLVDLHYRRYLAEWRRAIKPLKRKPGYNALALPLPMSREEFAVWLAEEGREDAEIGFHARKGPLSPDLIYHIRQRVAAEAERGDALTVAVRTILQDMPRATSKQVLGQLQKDPKFTVSDTGEDGWIDWDGASSPIRGLKHRVSRAKKKSR